MSLAAMFRHIPAPKPVTGVDSALELIDFLYHCAESPSKALEASKLLADEVRDLRKHIDEIAKENQS